MTRTGTGWRTLCVGLALGALLAAALGASAQEASKDVIGRWAGTMRAAAAGGGPMPLEVEFKPDGVFTGSVTSPQVGLMTYEGRWKADGSTVMVEYTAQAGTRRVQTSWSLKQDGDTLNGTGVRSADQIRLDINLKRAK